MDLGRMFHSFGPMSAKDVSHRVIIEQLVTGSKLVFVGWNLCHGVSSLVC